MKTLLVMRHAKSSWKQAGLADWERPLNKRGRRDAPRMGDFLRHQDLVPGLIVSSAARRARQTAEAVAEAAGYDGEVSYLDRLYGADPAEYVAVLRSLSDDVDCVMVIGHNPSLEDLLELLTDQWERLPTAAIAQIALSIHKWSRLTAGRSAQLVQVWRPRELP
jgi:phosphohistidine phosphatase